MVLAQKTVVRERRKNGELPTAQQISHLLLENALLVHHIRWSQLNGVESHGNPHNILLFVSFGTVNRGQEELS